MASATCHTIIANPGTELAESGAGDEVIMSIAGHVSLAMLSSHSHVRMEAKRRALEEIAARQREADATRLRDTQRQQQAAAVCHHSRFNNARAFSMSACGAWRKRLVTRHRPNPTRNTAARSVTSI